MFGFHSFHSLHSKIAKMNSSLKKVFFLDGFNTGKSRRASHRIAAIAARCRNRFKGFLKRLSHRYASHRETIAKAFTQRNNIRHDIPIFHTQPLAASAKACKYFVCHQQYALLVAEFAKFREEVVRRHYRTAPTLDRFKHKTSKIAYSAFVNELIKEFDILIGIHRAVRSCE